MTPRGECDSEHNAILGTLRGTIERLGWWTATFRGPLTRYFASPPLPLTLTATATLLPAAGPTCSARCCRPPQRPHHARPVSPRGRGLGRPPAPSVGRRRRSRTHSGPPRDRIRIVGRCRAGCCSNAVEGRRRGKTPSLHGTRYCAP